MKNSTIIISKIDNEWVSVRFPYNEIFINALKQAIEPNYRIWDFDNKIWKVHIAFLESLIGVSKGYFLNIKCDINLKKDPTELFNMLFENMNIAYIDKVYSSLAQAFHPDHKGNNEWMKSLNLSYNKNKGNRPQKK
jgi:hypothetical protein